MLGPNYQFDIVRLGAVLYGLNPVPHPPIRSQNVIRVTAPVLQIATVKAGESAGYGADYVFRQDGKIALVSIGYGDGILRHFFPAGKVWFQDGESWLPAPLAGRISMDNLICDVSHIPDHVLKNNPYATLIHDNYTADDFGQDAGTIGYEVLILLGQSPRFLKKYIPTTNF